MFDRASRTRKPDSSGSASPGHGAWQPIASVSAGSAHRSLAVGPANDRLEREADQASARVTSSSAPALSPAGSAVQRKTGTSPATATAVSASIQRGLSSPSQPLDHATRAALEPRFGVDFGAVRIHSGSDAAASARDVHADAYTSGHDIIFGASQYRPSSQDGQRLLAHELTHVVQQSMGAAQGIQRKVTFDECEAREYEVHNSHDRATAMADKTVAALRAYDGTNPGNVHDAMQTHFHSSKKFVANIVVSNLLDSRNGAQDAQYECHADKDNGSTLAMALWCIPFSDIQLFKGWFALTDENKRANTLVHEWIHRYACKFDLGYDWEESYKTSGTVRALSNAEPYGNIVQELGTS